MMVESNLRPSADGRRRASSAYRPGRSRRNSSENVSITASLYGVSTFEEGVGAETGFSSVSLTQSASASPVMIGIATPLLGMLSGAEERRVGGEWRTRGQASRV